MPALTAMVGDLLPVSHMYSQFACYTRALCKALTPLVAFWALPPEATWPTSPGKCQAGHVGSHGGRQVQRTPDAPKEAERKLQQLQTQMSASQSALSLVLGIHTGWGH